MTERERGGAISFCRILAPPMPPHDSKMLTILMTKMKDAIIFVGFWRPPPPSPDATILNHLNDSERGAPLSVVGFWRTTKTPPPGRHNT